MNYGNTLKMKIMSKLALLKENDNSLTLTFDQWTLSMI